MNTDIKLYRKRYIPNETVFLKDDIIYYADEDVIKTKWNVLKPRKDFASGISYYYPKLGWKISKFIDKDGKWIYYYCDIVDTYYDEKENIMTVTDLLADVKIYPDGHAEVVDLDEIADALEKKIINVETAKKALYRLDSLLRIIYSGKLKTYFEL